jgi:galactokinase
MMSSYERDVRATAQRALQSARAQWGSDWLPTRVAIAPGRIEILGNHTDYNGGPVLAAAIDRATILLSDDSDSLEVLFADFPTVEPITLDLDRSEEVRSEYGKPKPHDFVLGAIERSRSKDRLLRTGRTVVATSIPIGSGMSSSAALSVALTLVLNQEPPEGAELVYDAQAAENWTGVPCGTMDQSASVFGHVIRFEGPEGTRSITPDLGDYVFVVVESRVERTLGTSSYPIRVKECAEAVALLEADWGRPIGNLAGVSLEDLQVIDRGETSLTPVLAARVRHIVTDIHRVGLGEEAMSQRDWVTFGEVMNASGASSAGDYAISHPRVEDLVAVMRTVPGVAGARMMGGGEGGSTLALLHVDALDELRRTLVDFFQDESMLTSVVPLSFAPGARLLRDDDLNDLLQ